MITLNNVSKTFANRDTTITPLLSSVSLEIPCDRRIAVFASHWSLARTFVSMISGLQTPSSGRVISDSSLSFPIGHLGSFDRQLSVRHNIEYVARLYGADVDAVLDLVNNLADLSEAFDFPFGRLTPEQSARLCLITAYGIPFEMYLHVTDVAAAGAKKQLGAPALALMETRLSESGIMIPCRNLVEACEVCETALILHEGELHLVDDIRNATLVLDDLTSSDRYSDRDRKLLFRQYFGRMS